MIRKVFKKNGPSKFDDFLKKYKIPKEFLTFSRRSVARGAAVGIFVAVIPMPMQMVVVMLLLPIFRFNIIVGLSMVWLSNPVTMPAMYYIEYLTGNLLLGLGGVGEIHLTLKWFEDNFASIFIPLYTGTIFYALVLSSTSYYLITHLWRRSVHQEKKEKKHKRSLLQKVKDKIQHEKNIRTKTSKSDD